MDQIAIKCRGIKKGYGEKETRIEALKGVDLDIREKELTLLVGPSGSGKSTFLSIITTLLTPDEGSLHILGNDIIAMSGKEKTKFCQGKLGIVFQSLFLIPTLTVAENVSLPLLVAGLSQEEAAKKTEETLKRLSMSHRANEAPNNLSRGQQQRVAIARAIVNESPILVCDEPTSSLDQASGLEVMALLHDLVDQTSKTILVVTHDKRTFPFANRILYLEDGKITEGDKNA